MKKQIGIVHLIYTIIISLMLITFIAILAFGKSTVAGNQMNVAATSISIILAVIAILMTLVDVAGQRQSMIDLKETAESLNKSNNEAQKMFQKSMQAVENFENLKETLIKSVDSFKSETIERLEKLKLEGGTEELNTLIEKLEEENKLLSEQIKGSLKKQNIKKTRIKDVIDWFNSEFTRGELVPFFIFFNRLTNHFGDEVASDIMNLLEHNELIDFRDNGNYVKIRVNKNRKPESII
ncbi:hypothetical protein [Bacillus siamensis]|uniref:hypothetical protein n=1 Tax=Bacillus siamensis TaxID=659243 RepID=UPI0039EADEED